MIKTLISPIIISIFFTACSSSRPANLIDPMSAKRESVYIEPNNITELAEGMVDHIIQSSQFSKFTTYSFGKIENRSCEDNFDTEIISFKIRELLNKKTSKKNYKNSKYKFKGKLFQQCPFNNGKIIITTTLTLELIDESNEVALWSHSISMNGKSKESSWVLY